jgi:hypothetical protein
MLNGKYTISYLQASFGLEVYCSYSIILGSDLKNTRQIVDVIVVVYVNYI